MDANIEFNPITELTVENVKELEIHSTLSSLRRALAVKESIVVEGTDELPTIYYVIEGTEPIDESTSDSTSDAEEEIPTLRYITTPHVLSKDINRFLLMKSAQA